MSPSPQAPTTERIRVGGPQRVLLVVDPPALAERMAQLIASLPELRLAGAFSTAQDATEWTVWDREGWHFAFVDLNLKDGGTQPLVQRLLSQTRPGTVVALGAHLWQEIRQDCARMGVYHLLEKGDLVAFRGYLEEQVR
jgi:DNA-binding NarL/FixJ family response regulator